MNHVSYIQMISGLVSLRRMFFFSSCPCAIRSVVLNLLHIVSLTPDPRCMGPAGCPPHNSPRPSGAGWQPRTPQGRLATPWGRPTAQPPPRSCPHPRNLWGQLAAPDPVTRSRPAALDLDPEAHGAGSPGPPLRGAGSCSETRPPSHSCPRPSSRQP